MQWPRLVAGGVRISSSARILRGEWLVSIDLIRTSACARLWRQRAWALEDAPLRVGAPLPSERSSANRIRRRRSSTARRRARSPIIAAHRPRRRARVTPSSFRLWRRSERRPPARQRRRRPRQPTRGARQPFDRPGAGELNGRRRSVPSAATPSRPPWNARGRPPGASCAARYGRRSGEIFRSAARRSSRG
jgi:hypothetical protein